MEIIDTSTFFKWAAPYGIGLSTRYPASKTLSYNNSPETWTRWTVPKDYSAARILDVLIEQMGDWQCCWLYRTCGEWDFRVDPPNDPWFEMLGRFFDLKGLPRFFEGVLKLGRAETSDLLLFSFLQLMLPGSAATDVYLVSEDGKYIILLGHHDEIIVDCASPTILDELEKALEAKGFSVD